MASLDLPDPVCLASELLRESDPLDLEADAFDYSLTLCGYTVKVRAGSNFEATLKTSVVFYQLKILTENCEAVCRLPDEGSSWTYIVDVQGGYPRVILESMIKKVEEVDNSENPELQTAAAALPAGAADASNEDILLETLHRVFGFESFRNQQRETIVATMSGKNVLAIIGTGGGKSLTFMLPAVLARKPTVVISPTRSLIEDLHDRSIHLGLRSCSFLGSMDRTTLNEQLERLCEYMIIYATPEALDAHLLNVLTTKEFEGKVERIVFDEAHTICSWGSTFRPKYREVCEKLAQVNAPKLLLSATTPGKVQRDLKTMFGNDSWDIISHSVHRDNLCLKVKERDAKYLDDAASYIKSKKNECGIIYCVLPNDVSKVHAEFLKRGIDCVKYHGQLSEAVKQTSFQKWMNGDTKLIIANSSFGMGIDKANVRYVIHLRLPTSIEDYFQQCGRAGRDNLPSECILYYSYSDKHTLYKLFNSQGLITEQHTSLNELIACVEDVVNCRHRSIMQYFGEEREDFSCLSKCDNCIQRGSFFSSDGTNEALKVVQMMVELGEKKCNCNTLKLILSGSRQKKIQEKGFDELASFGCLAKKMSSDLLNRFLHRLIVDQVLQETIVVSKKAFVINVILGPKAHDVIGLQHACTKFVKK